MRAIRFPHHSGQPPLSGDLDLGNGEPILLVGVGDSLDLALQLDEHVSVTETVCLMWSLIPQSNREVDAGTATS